MSSYDSESLPSLNGFRCVHVSRYGANNSPISFTSDLASWMPGVLRTESWDSDVPTSGENPTVPDSSPTRFDY